MHLAWGKLSASGDAHALEAHMLDVAACFQRIILLKSVRRSLECAGERPLTDLDITRLSALAFLHDIGKANAGFQAKRWGVLAEVPPKGWPSTAGHVSEALQIFEREDLLGALPVDLMSSWGDSCLSLWRASISHHGRPVSSESISDPNIWKPVIVEAAVVYDPLATLSLIGQKLQAWFPAAFGVGPPLPDRPHFEHLFAGLVQLADWLGSDTTFFPYAHGDEDRSQTAWDRAEKAVSGIGMDASIWRSGCAHLPAFEDVFDVPAARPIQARMADPALGHLLILESETGSGKTEAALWRFAQLLQSGEVDGLYFALPTRVAATQLYSRVVTFAGRLWSDTENPPPTVVRALSGYEAADGHSITARLPNFDVLWADQPADREAHKRWAAENSKRFLAAPLAVGTIDQALLGSLQVRHAHMRHSLLARSLLVVDEVHASDAYMSALLAHLLKAHLHAGGHALLLSATLGSSARHRYQRLVDPTAAMPSVLEAIALPYPAVCDGASPPQKVGDSGRTKCVHWQVSENIDRPELIAEAAIDAAKHGAKVLVIRNTVPAALATFRAIEAFASEAGIPDVLFNVNGVPTVHHSRYSREDRPLMDQAVERLIGKRRSDTLQPCIVVGTQTLEQSLDIDADLLITDLCPMDVLLQRVGRLHRHNRPESERPEPYRTPCAVVLMPAGQSLEPCLQLARHGLGRFHNGGGIYTDLRILEATRRLITQQPSHLIPEMNRELVERATHPDVLHAIEEELGMGWQEHGQKVDGETLAHRVQANLGMLPFDKHFLEFDESGGELFTLTFPTADQRISSRLGANDYLLTFDPPMPGPFKQDVGLLPVRNHMWPKGAASDELPVVNEALPGGGFTFTIAGSLYRYSRLGLERINDQSKKGVS